MGAWVGPGGATFTGLGAAAGLDLGAAAGLDLGAAAGLDLGAPAGLDLGAPAGLDLGAAAGLDLGAAAGLDLDAVDGVWTGCDVGVRGADVGRPLVGAPGSGEPATGLVPCDGAAGFCPEELVPGLWPAVGAPDGSGGAARGGWALGAERDPPPATGRSTTLEGAVEVGRVGFGGPVGAWTAGGVAVAPEPVAGEEAGVGEEAAGPLEVGVAAGADGATTGAGLEVGGVTLGEPPDRRPTAGAETRPTAAPPRPVEDPAPAEEFDRGVEGGPLAGAPLGTAATRFCGTARVTNPRWAARPCRGGVFVGMAEAPAGNGGPSSACRIELRRPMPPVRPSTAIAPTTAPGASSPVEAAATILRVQARANPPIAGAS